MYRWDTPDHQRSTMSCTADSSKSKQTIKQSLARSFPPVDAANNLSKYYDGKKMSIYHPVIIGIDTTHPIIRKRTSVSQGTIITEHHPLLATRASSDVNTRRITRDIRRLRSVACARDIHDRGKHTAPNVRSSNPSTLYVYVEASCGVRHIFGYSLWLPRTDQTAAKNLSRARHVVWITMYHHHCVAATAFPFRIKHTSNTHTPNTHGA